MFYYKDYEKIKIFEKQEENIITLNKITNKLFRIIERLK